MNVSYVDENPQGEIVFDNTEYEKVSHVPKRRGRPHKFMVVERLSDVAHVKETVRTKRTLEEAKSMYMPNI